jgi:hypothetical protein
MVWCIHDFAPSFLLVFPIANILLQSLLRLHPFLSSFRLVLASCDELCQICSNILERSSKYVPQYDEDPWHTQYIHEFGRHAVPSTLEMSAHTGCFFCKQFWDSLTNQHREVVAHSDSAECIVVLHLDSVVAAYTKLGFFLVQGFDHYNDDQVKDIFEILHTNNCIHPARSSDHS